MGDQDYEYLRDMHRFRGDYEHPISACSYVAYLAAEIKACCQTYYPVGGMSAFIRAMEARALASGVRIFKGEEVRVIEKDPFQINLYLVSTRNLQVRAPAAHHRGTA